MLARSWFEGRCEAGCGIAVASDGLQQWVTVNLLEVLSATQIERDEAGRIL